MHIVHPRKNKINCVYSTLCVCKHWSVHNDAGAQSTANNIPLRNKPTTTITTTTNNNANTIFPIHSLCYFVFSVFYSFIYFIHIHFGPVSTKPFLKNGKREKNKSSFLHSLPLSHIHIIQKRLPANKPSCILSCPVDTREKN